MLIAVGKAHVIRGILNEIETILNPAELYIVVRPEIVPLLTERYSLTHQKAMLRMVYDSTQSQPTKTEGVVRLDSTDLAAVRQLYADGEASGEAPDWFLPEMLDQGVYYGIRENTELVAIAGTHVVSRREGVGCLGNIYTRRDRRGRGLSMQVTSAVTADLLSLDLQTIVLNVRETNAAAIRVYERVGFRRYCPFLEAVAIRQAVASPSLFARK